MRSQAEQLFDFVPLMHLPRADRSATPDDCSGAESGAIPAVPVRVCA